MALSHSFDMAGTPLSAEDLAARKAEWDAIDRDRERIAAQEAARWEAERKELLEEAAKRRASGDIKVLADETYPEDRKAHDPDGAEIIYLTADGVEYCALCAPEGVTSHEQAAAFAQQAVNEACDADRDAVEAFRVRWY
jgi:hypothetical protein